MWAYFFPNALIFVDFGYKFIFYSKFIQIHASKIYNTSNLYGLMDYLIYIILTLYEPNSFFRRFSGHNLR